IETATGAGIHRRAALSDRARAIGLERLGAAEAVVRVAIGEELRGVGLIQVEAFGLPIRTVRTAGVWPFVPVEAEPPEIAHDRALRFARRPLGVGVLDPQDERAILIAGEQPVEERGARVADVELPRRTR